MISMSVGLLGGVETAAASVGKKDGDGPAFADTFEQVAASGGTKVATRGEASAREAGPGNGAGEKGGTFGCG